MAVYHPRTRKLQHAESVLLAAPQLATPAAGTAGRLWAAPRTLEERPCRPGPSSSIACGRQPVPKSPMSHRFLLQAASSVPSLHFHGHARLAQVSARHVNGPALLLRAGASSGTLQGPMRRVGGWRYEADASPQPAATHAGRGRRRAPAGRPPPHSLLSASPPPRPSIPPGQVDCVAHQQFCAKNMIRAYPTLRMYKDVRAAPPASGAPH